MSTATQNPTVKRLQERRATLWEQAKSLADRASEENRNMSGEEDRQWAEQMSEMQSIDNRVQDILTGEERAQTAERSSCGVGGSAS